VAELGPTASSTHIAVAASGDEVGLLQTPVFSSSLLAVAVVRSPGWSCWSGRPGPSLSLDRGIPFRKNCVWLCEIIDNETDITDAIGQPVEPGQVAYSITPKENP
jgi:hypothetical protein